MLNRFFFLLYLLLRPELLTLPLKKIYIPAYVQFEWLKGRGIQTILDIGAHEGAVLGALNYIFPRAVCYAFEPDKRSLKKLQRKFKSKNNIHIIPLAISNKSGHRDFYKNQISPASSLLKLNEKYKNSRAELFSYKKSKIETTTLDTYFKGETPDSIFLKIDVQGCELLVLLGALNTLRNVAAIHIETPFDQLYKNQSTYDDIFKLLSKHGFFYSGSIPDAAFWPSFALPRQQNSVFFNRKYC